MSPIIKNILAVLAGVLVGMVVNMGIVMISGSIIPPPEGTDVSTMEGLEAAMPLMQPKHFLMPFLAHALGTLAGAFVTVKMATKHKKSLAMIVAFVFLIGGIMMVFSLPTPSWFTALDLIGAYIPMAWIAGKFVKKQKKKR